jgi:hypothetical protein
VPKSTTPPDTSALVPASIALQQLHDEAPTDHFTLGWLIGGLHKRAFGIIILLLAVVAIAPGVSIVAGLLLMVPALQMVTGQRARFSHVASPPTPFRRGALPLWCSAPCPP